MADSAVELETLPPSAGLITENTVDDEALASDLAPVDEGREAWLFILAAFILETFVWGFGFSYGVFQNYYASSPSSPFRDTSLSSLSAIGTTAIALPYMSGMILPGLMGRHPKYVKPAMWAALALGPSSLLLSSFANAVWQLILLQGVLLGVSSGVIYTPVILWLSEWFVRRRGLAGGIIMGGTGIGGAVFPPVLGLLLDRLGFRWTLRIWTLISVVFTAVGIWFMKPRLPVPTGTQPRSGPMDASYLRNPIFGVVGVTILLQALAFFPVSLYMPTYTSLLGLPSIDGQLALSIFNLFSVIGQVLIGWMCDHMPYWQVMFYSVVGSALSAYLLWGFASSLGLIFVFAVVFGTLSGGFFSIVPPIASELVGPSSPTTSHIFGSFAAMKGIAAIVGPIIAATLYDPSKAGLTSRFGSHGFGKITLFVGSMMMAAAVFSLLSGVASHVRRRHATRSDA